MSERDRSDRGDWDPTDWDSRNPVDREEGTGRDEGNAIQFRWWNLLLLVPLIMLITPLYNSNEPELFGMPYFYWFQFAFVFVGVASVGIVFVTTRDRHAHTDASGRPTRFHAGGADDGVDGLGSAR